MEHPASPVTGVKMLFSGQGKDTTWHVFWMYWSVANVKNELGRGEAGGRDWLGGCCSKQAGDDGI